MAGYNTIRGLRVKYLSANPSNPESGEVWYNSVARNLKLYGLAPGTVAAGGSPGGNAGKSQLGGCGTVTAGLMFGGEPTTGATEEYDGTSWANVNANPNTGTDMGSAGTQTAALWAGGTNSPSTASYEYDGTNWTTGGVMPIGLRFTVATCGTQVAAMVTGGFISPVASPRRSDAMQSYDGTSWTTIPQTYPSVGDTDSMRASGTQTAILTSGGASSATQSQDWDGSSWTANNPLVIGYSGGVQQGTQTASLAATGHPASPPPYGNEIQTYDGTNWSLSPATFVSGRAWAASAGTTSSFLIANGAPSVTTTEIYSGPALAVRTITTS